MSIYIVYLIDMRIYQENPNDVRNRWSHFSFVSVITWEMVEIHQSSISDPDTYGCDY